MLYHATISPELPQKLKGRARRACGLGIRSVLVADEGLLWLANEMKRAGAHIEPAAVALAR